MTELPTVSMERPRLDADTVPASLFGQNLEHTRSCLANGLSAQLLRNRKFCGKPSRDGVAAEWQPFGRDVYYELPQNDSFTRHDPAGYGKMVRRNEMSRQFIMHTAAGGWAGIVQKAIPLQKKNYCFKIALKDPRHVCGRIRIEFQSGGKTFAALETTLISGHWEVKAFTLTSPGDVDADLYVGIAARGSISIGMVSLLPEDHWHGMRPDVIEHLREIGTSLIRWPGGNFAGEYRWRDGLLAADERAPSQSATEIETQPYTHGFDDNELGTDEIIALCRRIGAEPYFTINATWDTPENSAAWVEYCNGSAATPMGRLRAERGFPEPFNVRFWSLGNEMGFLHMEGTKAPAEYARIVGAHASAMKRVSPEITLCSSGPLPDEAWERDATTPLAGVAPIASYHHYMQSAWDYSSPESLEEQFQNTLSEAELIGGSLAKMLRWMPENVAISYDEWNLWYVWFRQTGPLDGLWCGYYLHWLLHHFRQYGLGCACFFQPVNEGAITVTPRDSRLTAMGQAMHYISRHAGGEILPVADEDLFATRHADGTICVTLLNTDFHRSLKKTLLFGKRKAEVTRLDTPEILPGRAFAVTVMTAAELPEIELPPLSLTAVRFC